MKYLNIKKALAAWQELQPLSEKDRENNRAGQEGKLSPVELAALFHYRYIRIHPFEDDNGRIARLMVNFILTRHNYPMVVIRSRKKSEYLEALHQTDLEVGPIPGDGAHADIKDIRPFLKYFNNLVAVEIYNDVKEITGISIAAIQKLPDQLIQKKYVERGEKDGSWRVFVTQ